MCVCVPFLQCLYSLARYDECASAAGSLLTLASTSPEGAIAAPVIAAAMSLQLNSLVQLGRFDLVTDVYQRQWPDHSAVPQELRCVWAYHRPATVWCDVV